MGHRQLERWFPGITDDLVSGGARLGKGPAIQFYVDGALKAPVDDAQMIGATRPFLERSVRKHVGSLPGVRFVTGRASGLLLPHNRVRGVRFRSEGDGATHELEADLVVDAMGRSSRLGSWLEQAGWPAPSLERMRVDLGYATASFRRNGELPDTVIAHSSPGPASNYQPTLSEPGALTAVEDNRWAVVLVGYADYRPTRDPEAFLARMRRCVTPLQEVAQTCELEGGIDTFHFRESQRRQFTPLPRFPGGLVALGDAVASVNPIYGQGLTLATLQASSLAAHLRSGANPHEPARGYFRRAKVVVDAAWQLCTTADLAQPHVTGPYPRAYPVLRWTADRIAEASVTDPEINRVYMDVVNMVQHPRALTHPRILLRTARRLLTR
ncbi:NAD(P)/FAD-dependent oxidoreductase [Streptomyces sp. KR55]